MDRNLENAIAKLETLLHQQIEKHEKLLELLERKRAALRNASPLLVSDTTKRENEIIQQISEQEKQRLQMIADLTLHVDPQAKEPMTLVQFAERMPEPIRGRLLVLRAQLRERMQHVQRNAKVTRQATQTLVNHMQGLVQKITAVCNGVSVYGSNGATNANKAKVSTFSMTA